MLYLIGYDISYAKRLKLAEKCLNGYGDRVQYSLFECWLSTRKLKACISALSRIIDLDDRINIWPLCQYDTAKRDVSGKGKITSGTHFYCD